ncbi:MAG: N-methyl-L-tryptophan oxidase [Myxococcales bacterium]|nr:N-methyl-L-tryptophan oxidase [Myxococcales bacterium]
MWDAVVLGLGGVGAFALRALAQRGVKAVGVEQFESGHDRGSSHGETRVFRHAYFEHADYVPLLLHSTAEFRALGEAVGRPLIEACGTLLVGERDCDVLAAAEAAARRHGIDVEGLGTDELRARFPQFSVPDGHRGLFEPGGGFVRPEESIRAALEEARRLGAELRTGVRVERIEEGSDGVTLHTSSGQLRARRLIVTAGAWTAKLVPALARRLRVSLQVQAWITPPDPALVDPARFPAWLIVRGDEPPLYGIPHDPRAGGAVRAKVALHGRREACDPDAPRRALTDDDLEELLGVVRRWLPALGERVADVKSCLYTVTPDDHFVVDRVPGMDHVCCVAGLSGHGFKLTPALGQAVADLSLDGAGALPVGFLTLARFGG